MHAYLRADGVRDVTSAMLMPGAILGVRIMKQVVGQRAPNVMYKDPASGRLLAITSQPRVLLRWTVQKYPLQVQL